MTMRLIRELRTYEQAMSQTDSTVSMNSNRGQIAGRN